MQVVLCDHVRTAAVEFRTLPESSGRVGGAGGPAYSNAKMGLAGWAKRATKAAERGDAEEVMRLLLPAKGRGRVDRDMEYVLGAMARHKDITIGDFIAALASLGVNSWDILRQHMVYLPWFVDSKDEHECMVVAADLAKNEHLIDWSPTSELLKAAITVRKLDLFSQIVGFVKPYRRTPCFFEGPVAAAIETGNLSLARLVVSRVSDVLNEREVDEMIARVVVSSVRAGDRCGLHMLYEEFARPGMFERIQFEDFFHMLWQQYNERIHKASHRYTMTVVSHMMGVGVGAVVRFECVEEDNIS